MNAPRASSRRPARGHGIVLREGIGIPIFPILAKPVRARARAPPRRAFFGWYEISSALRAILDSMTFFGASRHIR